MQDFEHIYWREFKVTIKLCFHLNKDISSFSIVFLIAKQVEQHIFLSNHKISTIFKKNGTPGSAIWYIGTTGVSCLFSFFFKSYFSKKKKKRQQKILTTQFLTMLEKKSNISKTFVESLLKCFPLVSVSKSFWIHHWNIHTVS